MTSAAADPGRQYFFVHLMKTGGTTLRAWAERQFAVEDVFPRQEAGARLDNIARYLAVDVFLELPEHERRQIRCFSGHVPAVVAELVAPAALTITVVREPVERTLSYLRHCRRDHPEHDGLPLEAIYEDPWYYPRFIENYQTKMLSMTEAEVRQGSDDLLVRRLNPEGRSPEELEADPAFVDAVRQELHRGGSRAVMSLVDRAPTEVVVVDEIRLAAAAATLARLDLVGTTEHLDDLSAVLCERYGWSGGLPAPMNATGTADVSEAFRRRIARDNAADVVLHEMARRVRHRV